MELIDVSVPIRPGMIVWEDDRHATVERTMAISGGDPVNLTEIGLSVHTGTHVDAPLHFIDGAPAIESLPLDALVGPAFVVATDVPNRIDAREVERLGLPAGTERVLFKTRSGGLWERDSFEPDHVCLNGSGAQALVERGVRLAGIDYLSIGDVEAHEVLLGARVVPVEGLDLRRIEPGTYQLICLPLLIPGSDGAPARALLRPL